PATPGRTSASAPPVPARCGSASPAPHTRRWSRSRGGSRPAAAFPRRGRRGSRSLGGRLLLRLLLRATHHRVAGAAQPPGAIPFPARDRGLRLRQIGVHTALAASARVLRVLVRPRRCCLLTHA